MNRTDIINHVARTTAAANYLEIGVRNPADNFDKIDVYEKTGVDPAPTHHRPEIVRATSSAYFGGLVTSPAFDLVFIDGDHSFAQSYQDLKNAILNLSHGGTIILHDVLPAALAETGETKPPDGRPWSGNVWQTYLFARTFQAVDGFVVDCDHGVGVLRRRPFFLANHGEFHPLFLPPYEMSRRLAVQLYNVVTPAEFPERFKKLLNQTGGNPQ